MGFVIAYGFHIWELFGLRSWIVAFLTFSVGLPRQGGTLWSPTWVASAVTLFGVVASIGGNELALRYGRRRVLSIIMTTSAMLACAVGFTATLDFPLVALFCLIYGGFVMADSASLTIGAVENATPGHRGATMAVHSSIGFIGAFLGPLCFGAVLDGAGGADHATAWGWAFASSGAAVACGALALALLNPQARTRTRS
jgi:MFS family permease